MALTGSSFAMVAGDSEGAAEPATDGALDGALEGVVGMLGLAMLGALPVPWTGGILIEVDLVIVYEKDESTVERKCQTRQSIYVCNEAIIDLPAALWNTHLYTRGTWQTDASLTGIGDNR
jgi:hypothetical protein